MDSDSASSESYYESDNDSTEPGHESNLSINESYETPMPNNESSNNLTRALMTLSNEFRNDMSSSESFQSDYDPTEPDFESEHFGNESSEMLCPNTESRNDSSSSESDELCESSESDYDYDYEHSINDYYEMPYPNSSISYSDDLLVQNHHHLFLDQDQIWMRDLLIRHSVGTVKALTGNV